MRRRSVLISSVGSAANGATASSIIAGSISGSSPWTLTIELAIEGRRDFGQPIGAAVVAADVIRTSPPNARTALAIRSSSVATITAATERAALARR